MAGPSSMLMPGKKAEQKCWRCVKTLLSIALNGYPEREREVNEEEGGGERR